MTKGHCSNVVLQPLTIKDAEFLYDLYSHPQLVAIFDESPFLPNETALEFTTRIILLCEFIFTIRPVEIPDLIIGDCALHNWNKETSEVMIGGSLHPDYWGRGFMQCAFQLLSEIAKKDMVVRTLLGQTKTANHNAIRLVEKMGFKKYQVDENDTIMGKEL